MYFWADTPDGVEFGVHGVEKDPAALAVLPAMARVAAPAPWLVGEYPPWPRWMGKVGEWPPWPLQPRLAAVGHPDQFLTLFPSFLSRLISTLLHFITGNVNHN